MLLTFVLFVTISGNNCPKPETIEPCVCYSVRLPNIICSDIEYDFDLKTIFKNISHELVANVKHFESFKLINTSITEIPDNVFADIIFENIFIDTNPVLTRIHTNAFNGTQDIVLSFSALYSPIVSTGPDYDLFRAFKSLNNLEQIAFYNISITEIPDQAFDELINLVYISIKYGNLKTIGQNIIRNFKNIDFIDFGHNIIDTIGDNAFTIDVIHSSPVRIFFYNNSLYHECHIRYSCHST